MAVRYAPCLGSLVTSSRMATPWLPSKRDGKGSELVVEVELNVDDDDVLLVVVVNVDVLQVNRKKHGGCIVVVGEVWCSCSGE
eukprot:6488289-Amphidinium_carterae.1